MRPVTREDIENECAQNEAEIQLVSKQLVNPIASCPRFYSLNEYVATLNSRLRILHIKTDELRKQQARMGGPVVHWRKTVVANHGHSQPEMDTEEKEEREEKQDEENDDHDDQVSELPCFDEDGPRRASRRFSTRSDLSEMSELSGLSYFTIDDEEVENHIDQMHETQEILDKLQKKHARAQAHMKKLLRARRLDKKAVHSTGKMIKQLVGSIEVEEKNLDEMTERLMNFY